MYRILIAIVVQFLLLSPVLGQTVNAINGQCSKGGQNVLYFNIPSTGTQPIGGGVKSTNTGALGSYPSCSIQVFLTGTQTQATLYANAALSPLTNPFTANLDGSFLFYAQVGQGYDIFMSGGGLPATVPLTDVFPGTPSGIAGSGTVNPGTSGQQAVYQNGAVVGGQNKLIVDIRDAFAAAGSSGAKCDGVTDDTAAIQALFNYYGNGGGGATQGIQIQFPAASCKISNELVYEGNNSLGIRIVGQAGWGSMVPNSQLAWFGPNFGTMMLMLGCNNCSVENLDFNASPVGGGQAQNGLWFDASNTVTQTSYNISAISRTGNVVTVTTASPHAVTAVRIVKVAGSTGGTTSFNGTFQVLYANDNTHISWAQTGPNESGTASTGTVTNYKSSPSNNLGLTRVKVSNPESVSSVISAIQGTATSTSLTTSTAHFIELRDTVIVRGVTDTSYNCAWLVTAVGTSTTATLKVLPGEGCSPSNAASSGGTVLSGSSGIRVGHVDTATEQVSQLMGRDVFIQGDQLGGSVNCLECDGQGNVKNFAFDNVIVNGCRYGFNGFNSGNFNVTTYNGGNVTPDSSTQLSAADFVNNSGQITVDGGEIEAGNDRFFVNTGTIGSTVHLDGISFQSNCPTDDICVSWGGQMTITASSFYNRRASNAVPYLSCGNPLLGANGCSLISRGNFYANSCLATASGGYCSSSGSSVAPGFLPFKDGSGNGWMQSGGFYSTRATNIESKGDFSSATNDNSTPTGPLFNVDPASIIPSTSFANLPSAPPNGMLIYCSDCKNVTDDTTGTFDSVAASGGHGTNVLRENGAWRVH